MGLESGGRGRVARHRLDREPPAGGAGPQCLRPVDVPRDPLRPSGRSTGVRALGQIVFARGSSFQGPRGRRHPGVSAGAHGGGRSAGVLALPLPELRLPVPAAGIRRHATDAFPFPSPSPATTTWSSAAWARPWSSPTAPRSGRSCGSSRVPTFGQDWFAAGDGALLGQRAFRCRARTIRRGVARRRSSTPPGRGHVPGRRLRPDAARGRDGRVLERDDAIPAEGTRQPRRDPRRSRSRLATIDG